MADCGANSEEDNGYEYEKVEDEASTNGGFGANGRRAVCTRSANNTENKSDGSGCLDYLEDEKGENEIPRRLEH